MNWGSIRAAVTLGATLLTVGCGATANKPINQPAITTQLDNPVQPTSNSRTTLHLYRHKIDPETIAQIFVLMPNWPMTPISAMIRSSSDLRFQAEARGPLPLAMVSSRNSKRRRSTCRVTSRRHCSTISTSCPASPAVPCSPPILV
jgi:hypothetical protein